MVVQPMSSEPSVFRDPREEAITISYLTTSFFVPGAPDGSAIPSAQTAMHSSYTDDGGFPRSSDEE